MYLLSLYFHDVFLYPLQNVIDVTCIDVTCISRLSFVDRIMNVGIDNQKKKSLVLSDFKVPTNEKEMEDYEQMFEQRMTPEKQREVWCEMFGYDLRKYGKLVGVERGHDHFSKKTEGYGESRYYSGRLKLP
jgi:hypothetical protein